MNARRMAESPWSVPLAAGLVGIIVFLPAIRADYVYDDLAVLFLDDRLGDPARWSEYLTDSYNFGIDNLYRPLTSLSLAGQAWVHGVEGPWASAAFRAVNLLLYGLICGLAAVLTRRLSGSRAAGLAAGLVFAVHPVHVEIVAGVVGRAELLASAAFLGFLVLLTRPLTSRTAWACVALAVVALGAKEQGLLLPFVAAAWCLTRRGDETSPPTRQAALTLAAGLTLVTAAYLLWRESILPMAWPRSDLDWTIQPLILAGGTADRLLMALAVAGRYLRALVWPDTLAIDHGAIEIMPPASWTDLHLWLGILALSLTVAAALHAWRTRWGRGGALVAWFVLAYGMIANFPVLIGTAYGERLIFLPGVFVVIYLTLLAARWNPDRRWAVVGVAVLCLAGTVRTWQYLAYWTDRLDLYAYQTRTVPRAVRGWLLVGEEQRQRGDLAAAAHAAETATGLTPDYYSAWMLRARVAAELGRWDEALAFGEEMVRAATNPITVDEMDRLSRLAAEARDPVHPPPVP